MNKTKKIILTAIMAISICLGTNAAVKNGKPSASVKTVKPAAQAAAKSKMPPIVYEQVNPLTVVISPEKYLNKHIKIRAEFDKFSTLGLDYKPAYRSSEKYITFLIKRDDVINNVVPLSEMKNFLARDIAEKYIDLKPGDDIEYTGLVFSNALGDVWISVDNFTVLKQNTPAQDTTKK